MKQVLFGFVALAVLFALDHRAIAAPVEFYLDAYSSESDITGTITIDTATRNVLGANLAAYQGNTKWAVFNGHISVGKFYNRTTISILGYDVKSKTYAGIVITIEKPSLVGYSGGFITGDWEPIYLGPEFSFEGELVE